MDKYVVKVRVMGNAVNTLVFADSAIHARLLVQYQFGMNSLVSSPIKAEGETDGYQVLDEIIKAHKPLTPQQQRIMSLQTQKNNASKQLRAERDRQKLQKARQSINAVFSKSKA